MRRRGARASSATHHADRRAGPRAAPGGTPAQARHPTFRAVDPLTWLVETDYLELDLRPSLRAFTKQRAALLELLGPLPRKGWSRAATVTGAGRPLERTVLDYADWVAIHERPHLDQIARIVVAV